MTTNKMAGWQCCRCHYLMHDSNPRWCPNCGYTIYVPFSTQETPAEPQQPATAAHSDAQRQREQLRERIAFVLHDTDCSGCAEAPTVVDRYYRLADAVLPILDEELNDYRNTLDKALREREEAERKYDELYVGQGAHQVLQQVRDIHAKDTSNPLGPWCSACSVPWPCPTARALNGDTGDSYTALRIWPEPGPGQSYIQNGDADE